MSEELNVIESESEVIDSPEQAEAATAEEKPVNGYEKRISTLTARSYQKDKRIQELEAQIKTKQEPEPKPIEVPSIPSDDLRYEKPEEYDKQLQAYHNAVAIKAQADAQKLASEQAEAAKIQEKQAEQNQRFEKIVNTYVENGLKSGISEVKMGANEEVLKTHSLTPDLAEFIYRDPNGAQIVDYLADNPDKIQELISAPPGQAYVEIANTIKPQALSKKPTHTGAPNPIEPTNGSGVVPSDGLPPILAGVTIE